jgi:two-component system, OmpR family, sensor histidine kinase SenX3
MLITSRRKTIAFFVVLGSCLVALALVLNITWIIHWRAVFPVVLGIIFFGMIIAGLTLNTIFLVREIRRNEQHDSFINAVTHELKTPIASIRLYLETLQNRPVDDKKREEFYRIMLADTDRLLNTVDQVLKAGQLAQKHRGQEAWHEVDMADIVTECVEMARTRHHLEDSALTFTSHAVTKSDSTVFGDADELRSAVSNLIDNAVKYSGDHVEIRVEMIDEVGDVLVRVKDKGVGISRPELKQIFKRFYRAHIRSVAKVKGTGLGLFIVRSIARRHGGDAFAESEGEGRGATVTIRLPRSMVQ